MFSTFRNTAIVAAALALGAGLAVPAQAGFIATMDQIGGNVVVTGSGSFDTAGLTSTTPFPAHPTAAINPSLNVVILGGAGTNNAFTGLTPDHATFGSGGATKNASSASGAVLGIGDASAGFNSLYLPNGYVSGTSVSDITTFAGATFTGLGVTPGTYEWTWGTGATADSFTLQIGPVAAAPEPASLPLLVMGLAGLGLVVRRRRA